MNVDNTYSVEMKELNNEIISMDDISKIPRLPGDGAQDDTQFQETLKTCQFRSYQSTSNNGSFEGEVKSSENQTPFNNEAYSAFKRGNVVKGILLPSLTNSFRNRSLERSYLTYSHRQRQKSLLIVNLVDLVLKIVLAVAWASRKSNGSSIQPEAEAITWSIGCVLANMGICILGLWKCFANNYLHWAATCTWLLLNIQGFVGECVGFADKECMVWYMLFIIFVPYAMLPLPLIYCMVAGTVSGVAHIIVMTIEKLQTTYDSKCIVRLLLANSLLYLSINFAGMYTKYLTDRKQRLAFIETHKAMEHKKDSEKEYQRTQKLLDSSKMSVQKA